MRVIVTGRHVEIPENFKELLVSKVEKLERFGHQLIKLHAIFGRERYLYTAELTLTAKGFILVGHAKEAGDLLTCAEEAVMKLKEQLCRRESKRSTRLRHEVRHRAEE